MLGLLALAGVGLLIVDAVSYAELHSYLSGRVDQQVQSAVEPVSHTIFFEEQGRRKGEIPPGPPGLPARGPIKLFTLGGPPPGDQQLPLGTYGAILGPNGKVRHHTPFPYGGGGVARPVVPARPPLSASPASLNVFTVASSQGSSDFRAAAVPVPGSRATLLVAVPLSDIDQTLAHVRLVGIIVTAAVLAALAALAWWVIRVGLRPLRRMEQTANAIAAGDLSARVETTDERTEVGRLGVALNAMLGQIERAFAERASSENRLRRFLADASHELRTPLSSIRGYAEAFRLGPARQPDQLDKSMRRIEDESTRMGGLVDDLLTLARLDEVRERVREPVDLSVVAADACEDAGAAAPDRSISLQGGEGTVVEGDPDQLRQVMTNLLRNAVDHTPSGTPVEVTVAADDGLVKVDVRDHGEGLPPGTEDQVFERFWRRDPARPRDGGGAGLGLAIVEAIVGAHGGRASASNAADGGAVFEVTLPRRRGSSSQGPLS
jgi:two-component system OmpR family sensor kinase